MTGSVIIKEGDLRPLYLKIIFLWFLTSFFVLIEPAPFDLVFPVVVFLFLDQGRILLPRKSQILFPCLLLFLIANILSILAAESPARAGFFVVVTVYMFLLSSFIAVIVSNYGYSIINKIMKAYVIVAVFSAMMGVLGLLRFLPMSWVKYVTAYNMTRACGFFKDPNVFAPFLLVALVYAVDKIFSQKERIWMWGGSVFILLFGILVSFSRAAWGVTLLALFLYFSLSALAERRFLKLIKYMSYLLGMAFVGGLLLFIFAKEANLSDFIEQRLSMQSYDQDRFEVQGAAISAGLQSIIGIGAGQSEDAFVGLVSRGQMTGATHSLFVRVIAETGILGAISFFAILYITTRKALHICLYGSPKTRRLNCVFVASFFALLVNSTVIDSLHWRHFFVVIGIIWGLDLLISGVLGTPTDEEGKIAQV